jgi:hypothetical protein
VFVASCCFCLRLTLLLCSLLLLHTSRPRAVHRLSGNLIGVLEEPGTVRDSQLVNMTQALLQGGLVSLWSHCQMHLDDMVYHVGSNASGGQLDVVIGSSWKLCVRELRRGASVCAEQVTARPYLHVPGNAFWARCDYISTLESPEHSAPLTRPCAARGMSELVFPVSVVRVCKTALNIIFLRCIHAAGNCGHRTCAAVLCSFHAHLA